MEYYLAMRKNEIWPLVATWLELESVMLSEISHAICFHSNVYPEKLNKRPCGRGRGKKVRGREGNHNRLLKTENKLRVDGEWEGGGKWVMGIEEGTCWDDHWVLYGNQFVNKFHI